MRNYYGLILALISFFGCKNDCEDVYISKDGIYYDSENDTRFSGQLKCFDEDGGYTGKVDSGIKVGRWVNYLEDGAVFDVVDYYRTEKVTSPLIQLFQVQHLWYELQCEGSPKSTITKWTIIIHMEGGDIEYIKSLSLQNVSEYVNVDYGEVGSGLVILKEEGRVKGWISLNGGRPIYIPEHLRI